MITQPVHPVFIFLRNVLFLGALVLGLSVSLFVGASSARAQDISADYGNSYPWPAKCTLNNGYGSSPYCPSTLPYNLGGFRAVSSDGTQVVTQHVLVSSIPQIQDGAYNDRVGTIGGAPTLSTLYQFVTNNLGGVFFPVVPELMDSSSVVSTDAGSATSITLNQGQSVTLSWDLQPYIEAATIVKMPSGSWIDQAVCSVIGGNTCSSGYQSIGSPQPQPLRSSSVVDEAGPDGFGSTYFTMSRAQTSGSGFTSAPSNIGSVVVTPPVGTTNYTLSVPIQWSINNPAYSAYLNKYPDEIFYVDSINDGDNGSYLDNNWYGNTDYSSPSDVPSGYVCQSPTDTGASNPSTGNGQWSETCSYDFASDPNTPSELSTISKTITFSIPITVTHALTPSPSLIFAANPITTGQSTTATWSVTDAASCKVYNADPNNPVASPYYTDS
ncbi:MAG TPA: hypothetical protein VIJ88_02985, partial [Candidatus Paceibacterota bacterium]